MLKKWIYILIILWYLSGLGSFIYWETTQRDVTIKSLIFPGTIIALAGPMVFPVGYFKFTSFKSSKDIILFKKK